MLSYWPTLDVHLFLCKKTFPARDTAIGLLSNHSYSQINHTDHHHLQHHNDHRHPQDDDSDVADLLPGCLAWSRFTREPTLHPSPDPEAVINKPNISTSSSLSSSTSSTLLNLVFMQCLALSNVAPMENLISSEMLFSQDRSASDSEWRCNTFAEVPVEQGKSVARWMIGIRGWNVKVAVISDRLLSNSPSPRQKTICQSWIEMVHPFFNLQDLLIGLLLT